MNEEALQVVVKYFWFSSKSPSVITLVVHVKLKSSWIRDVEFSLPYICATIADPRQILVSFVPEHAFDNPCQAQ